MGLGFSIGVVTSGVVFSSFWPTLPDPGGQTNEPIFWLKVFLKTRLSSESLELLVIGYLAYLEPKLWIKNKKIGKNCTPTNANVRRKAPRAIDGYNSLSEWARELYKLSKYSWSLVVCNKRNSFSFGCRFFVYVYIMGGRFCIFVYIWMTSSSPGNRPIEPILWLKVFLDSRL